MFKSFKQRLIQKIQIHRPNYVIEDKIHIAIQLNNYFTRQSWLEKIKEIVVENPNVNFLFVQNKFKFLRITNFCDGGFFFDLSSSYVNSSTKLKILYLGVSGHEFDPTVFPKIKVYSSKGISSLAIAEYVLSTTILIVNGYNKCIENKVLRRWKQKSILSQDFKRIENYKIGIWGVGNNGKAISEKFAKLGCKVFGCDKQITNEFPFIHQWFMETEIEKFCNTIDIFILCIPWLKQTKDFINYNFIKNHLEGKYIINVARGNIINQEDLKRCLREKILAGAVLDVFEKEPLPIYDSLWHFKDVIITPHISGNINRFVSIIQEDFLKIIVSEFNLKTTA
jgi:phosphoglycerate dehydrogenase-like enzyme